MLGYFLAFPVVCVVVERLRRLYLTFCGHHLARLQALDGGAVVITAERKNGQDWHARAGQFVGESLINKNYSRLTQSCRYCYRYRGYPAFSGILSPSAAAQATFYKSISRQTEIGRGLCMT